MDTPFLTLSAIGIVALVLGAYVFWSFYLDAPEDDDPTEHGPFPGPHF